jgi:hypothetical protein
VIQALLIHTSGIREVVEVDDNPPRFYDLAIVRPLRMWDPIPMFKDYDYQRFVLQPRQYIPWGYPVYYIEQTPVWSR